MGCTERPYVRREVASLPVFEIEIGYCVSIVCGDFTKCECRVSSWDGIAERVSNTLRRDVGIAGSVVHSVELRRKYKAPISGKLF
jgi:hypothetical protein